MKKLAALFLFTFNSYSLELGEKLRVKLEKVLPENIVVFSKGKSDHIRGFDQIKIFDGERFIARGLSLGAGRYRSSWKIFRVVSPESFKIGKSYKIESIIEQDVPWEYLDKSINHYRQIVIDFYPSSSANFTRVDEGDFSKQDSKTFLETDE